MSDELRLSPSSINTFFRCPRCFYYNYLLKERGPFNIHLYKGSFVHKAIEKLFENTTYVDVHKYMEQYMEKWNPPDYLFENDKEKEHHTREAKEILERYADHVDKKLDMTLIEGSANNENHAWNRIRPQLSEHRIKDEELNLLGIIDSIQKNFDGKVYVTDYKTSKLYKDMFSEEYIRQVCVYAYLYEKKFGEYPDYVGINYLRYSELFFMPVEFVEDKVDETVRDAVSTIREKLAETQDLEDYPMCEFDWCDCKTIAKRLDHLEEEDEDNEE